MRKERVEEARHYLALISLLLLGGGLFWVFNYNRSIQIWLVVGMGILYVGWGAIHHLIHKDFYWHIFVEYLAVALITCASLVFILVRA